MKPKYIIAACLLLLLPEGSRAELPEQQQTLIIIGDQSCSRKNNLGADPASTPYAGWGEVLTPYFRETLTILDKGRSGRSTKSFIEEGRWDAASTLISKGNVVMIQFGHNDEKDFDPSRYTDPYGTYYDNLKLFVETVKSKGATPILLTPIARYNFSGGKLVDTHGDYPDAMRKVAKETDCYLIDLTAMTSALYSRLGEKKAAEHFYVLDGDKDVETRGVSRHSYLGAKTVAKMIVAEVKKQNIEELTEYLQ
ncbi:MAG: rhamnogalacturonan acetylesterase [Bacteroidales bacterium]|nr:rhamnogalacturonan acetylesterase [Candidatus Cryptobacteroides aphodequi]